MPVLSDARSSNSFKMDWSGSMMPSRGNLPTKAAPSLWRDCLVIPITPRPGRSRSSASADMATRRSGKRSMAPKRPRASKRGHIGISHGFLEPAGEAGMSHAMLDTLGSALERPEVLANGPAGSVYLCYPVLVHAAQMHRGSVPRFMAQPPLHPAEPFKLDRPDDDYSPVEIANRQAIQEGGNQERVGGKRQKPTSDTSRYGLNDAAFCAQRRAVGRR